MANARLTVWNPLDELTAAALNAEFNNELSGSVTIAPTGGDDTALIQDAFARAVTTGGGSVCFRPGAYSHTGLTLTNVNNLALYGMGRPGVSGAAGLYCTNAAADSLKISNGAHIAISGLYIGHSIQSNTGIAAIRALGVNKLSLTDVSTQVFPVGSGSMNGLILEGGTSDAVLTWVTRCIFSDHRENGISLMGSTSTKRVIETLLSGCVLFANGGAGVRIVDYVAGVYIRNGTNFGVQNGRSIDIVTTVNDARTLDIFVSDCILDVPVNENIRAKNVSSVHIFNNWIASAGALSGNVVWGIDMLTGAANTWLIKDNYIAFNRGGGIRFAGDSSSITGNHFNTNGGLAVTPTAMELTATSTNNFVTSNFFLGHTVSINDLGVANEKTNNHS